MLAEMGLKCLLCIANVDMMTDLASCFIDCIDQEVMMAFPTKWALSINLRYHRTIAGPVNTVAAMYSIHQFFTSLSRWYIWRRFANQWYDIEIRSHFKLNWLWSLFKMTWTGVKCHPLTPKQKKTWRCISRLWHTFECGWTWLLSSIISCRVSGNGLGQYGLVRELEHVLGTIGWAANLWTHP